MQAREPALRTAEMAKADQVYVEFILKKCNFVFHVHNSQFIRRKSLKKSVIILFALLSTLASAQLGGKVVKKSGPQQPTTQHQVALTWTQSTGPGTITGNNVYRCTGNACTGYALLYSSTTPILAYTDTTVAAGATYTYVVTAVAGAEESNYSSQYVAVIRNPPAAPTGLAGTAQ